MGSKEQTFSLRQVVELTGLSEFTLRAWELRYKTVTPKRTESGRRRYSRQDILKFTHLRELIAHGHRIGQIVNLPLPELENLIVQGRSSETPTEESEKRKVSKEEKEILKLLELADQYDWDSAQDLIRSKLRSSNPENFIFKFVLILTAKINERVEQNLFSITQEHILSAFIKEALQTLKANQPLPKKSTMRVVIATPEGDWHELGILIASALSALFPTKQLYLGPHVPKSDLAEACLRFKATHLVLASTVSKFEGAIDETMSYINYIDRHVQQNVTFWLGGRNLSQLELRLKRKSAILKDLTSLYDLFARETKNIGGKS